MGQADEYFDIDIDVSVLSVNDNRINVRAGDQPTPSYEIMFWSRASTDIYIIIPMR